MVGGWSCSSIVDVQAWAVWWEEGCDGGDVGGDATVEGLAIGEGRWDAAAERMGRNEARWLVAGGFHIFWVGSCGVVAALRK